MSGSRVRALISLGTNTTRLLVIEDRDGGRVVQLEHGGIGTRLGEGLRDGGRLAPAAIDRNLAAIGEFVARARARGAESFEAIATSAMRRADDADAFAARVSELVGAPLVVLDGSQEAVCGFRGAMFDAPRDGARRAVLDIGGGSTESAVGIDGVLERARSVEIGSVRLTEGASGIDGSSPGEPAREAARRARSTAREMLGWLRDFAPVAEVRAVAGTPMTVAAVSRASPDLESTIGSRLERAEVDAVIERLLDLDLAARRAVPGMVPQRADIIVAGAILLSEAMGLYGVDRVTIEANDLLLGWLLRERR